MAKRTTKTYDQELKSQAVKLAQKIGGHKAAEELGVPSGTIYSLQRGSFRGQNVHTLSNALSLNEELIELRKRIKEMDKENKRLK